MQPGLAAIIIIPTLILGGFLILAIIELNKSREKAKSLKKLILKQRYDERKASGDFDVVNQKLLSTQDGTQYYIDPFFGDITDWYKFTIYTYEVTYKSGRKKIITQTIRR